MTHLPVIVGFGGISPAGRSSFFHGYRRLVADAIDINAAVETYVDLAMLMGLVSCDKDEYQVNGERIEVQEIIERFGSIINNNTLIRKIEKQYLDVDAAHWNQATEISASGSTAICFEIKISQLPNPLPENWTVKLLDNKNSQVTINGMAWVLLPTTREFLVKSAGQLPSGFDLSKAYKSRHHPKGLQMTMFGASDAIQSLGVDWETVLQYVAPDKVSVYASSAMSQLDENGNGGLMGSRLKGKKVSSKHLALGLTQMPADFINAYLLGNLGSSGGNTGACASFLYNLKMGVEDIQQGKSRVAIIGAAEAPITSEIIDGYTTMGALAMAEHLRALDGNEGEPDYKRACRPFSDNCGFTLSESAQFVVLFEDTLALQLGMNILGAVDNVFINADGYKKSISSPCLGNWITMAKAVASAKALLGQEGIQRSYVQAHGTGTQQNRVTESEILNQTAKAFSIKNWTVTGIKSYLGHSIGSSAGDQLMATLGAWQYGVIPGIKSIDHLADDVQHSNLNILMNHKKITPADMDITFLNSKGFGGNNASAGILSPQVTRKFLTDKHGVSAMDVYENLNISVNKKAKAYDQACLKGEAKTIYRFDYQVKQGKDIDYNHKRITIPGWDNPINLELSSPYVS